uniref:Uncharacterized protein n=1 Tax=Romanomermis culicivorax TaxID=13658 RepID=A0A915JEI9_ROMCU
MGEPHAPLPNLSYKCSAPFPDFSWKYISCSTLLEGFLGGAQAVPLLANVGEDVTIQTRAQQKWLASESVD